MNVRLDVDAGGYDSAADALSTANGTTATAFDDLVGDLGGFGGMGGDDKSSEDWVANYDPAARDTVLAIVDLTTAWGNLARASASSGANHRDANAGSVYRGDGGATGSEATPDVREVSASTPPSALGADGGDMPDGWDLIVDHLQGWTWPSADVDRLRQAASSWRTAAGMIEYTPSDGASARSQLGSQKSPEIPQATRAIGDVERAAGDVATACRDLADSCDDYATQVETTRETIKGLLRDLLIEIAATAAVSALGSLVTFGGAAAAGAAVAVTRAIACARKIIKVLVALKGVRAVATAARSVSKITRRPGRAAPLPQLPQHAAQADQDQQAATEGETQLLRVRRQRQPAPLHQQPTQVRRRPGAHGLEPRRGSRRDGDPPRPPGQPRHHAVRPAGRGAPDLEHGPPAGRGVQQAPRPVPQRAHRPARSSCAGSRTRTATTWSTGGSTSTTSARSGDGRG